MSESSPKGSTCLAEELFQLFKFKQHTSFADILSKVTEVLAFVENVSQGFIRLIEPKPLTYLWATGQCGCGSHNRKATVQFLLCLSFV